VKPLDVLAVDDPVVVHVEHLSRFHRFENGLALDRVAFADQRGELVVREEHPPAREPLHLAVLTGHLLPQSLDLEAEVGAGLGGRQDRGAAQELDALRVDHAQPRL